MQGLARQFRHRQLLGQYRHRRDGQAYQSDSCQGQHRQKEISRRQLVGSVEVQILGIAHRSGHTAQVGGDGLQHQHRHYRLAAAQLLKKKQCERHKGDQRHVVGHRHGDEEGQQHQNDPQGPGSRLPPQQLLRQPLECPAGLDPRHHRHQAQQQAQHPQIDITDVFPVRRHKDHGDQSTYRRHAQHRLSLCKGDHPCFHSFLPRILKYSENFHGPPYHIPSGNTIIKTHKKTAPDRVRRCFPSIISTAPAAVVTGPEPEPF